MIAASRVVLSLLIFCAPLLAEENIEANEKNAVIACRAFVQAEEIYHRTDYNHDGILEYAQTIHGGLNASRKQIASAPTPKPAPEERDKIDALIKQMGNDDFNVRDKACADLAAIGKKTIEQLQAVAAAETDPEIANRCRKLVEKLSEEPVYGQKTDFRYGMYKTIDPNGSGTEQEIGLVDKAMAEAECPRGTDPATIVARTGYFFRVLTGQGGNAPGGKRSYIPDGMHMVLGYALLVFPKEYGTTGRNIYMINKSGIVLRRDFGSKDKTEDYVRRCTEFDPEADLWEPAQ